MEKEEFVKKAKTMGYSDEDIKDIMDTHEDAEKHGIKSDYKDELIELPICFP